MKNAINYFYNLDLDNLRMVDDDYFFSCGSKKFVFQKIKDIVFDSQAVLELNRILLESNQSFFRILTNKNNEIITTISNQQYILMLDNGLLDRKFDYDDILDTNILLNTDNHNKLINRLNRSNWMDMWKSKIDYFESFISHKINKYSIINKYANYFIGLAEVAINYVRNTLNETKPDVKDNVVVCHKRIDGNSLKQLYNPLSLIIDHQSRDMTEYLKRLFFDGKFEDIEKCINSIHLSNYGARLLMSRMLFPSFFFDLFEKTLENKSKERELLYLVDRMNDYELYLSIIYNVLQENNNIPEITWIKKVDYSSTLTTPNTSGTSFTNIDSIPSLSVTSIMLQ